MESKKDRLFMKEIVFSIFGATLLLLDFTYVNGHIVMYYYDKSKHKHILLTGFVPDIYLKQFSWILRIHFICSNIHDSIYYFTIYLVNDCYIILYIINENK
jgi:hypothetical protein